ncbi:hypothetical protein ACQ859_11490 [Roseateles chitinivorans]|uniref:hypothetical protein n=1 Tax=Roseateles chitinivorans TaxID=2917965 RepID=UPI003D6659DF
MGTRSTIFRFRSDLFEIDPQEDEETNPFCYGRSLAKWIRARFVELGYRVEPIIAEDWGWCVMLSRDPFMLWIGCGNDRSVFYDDARHEGTNSVAPDGRDVDWTCYVGTDVPAWTSFFWRRLLSRESLDQQVVLVSNQLRTVLTAETRIALIDDRS